jgi:hypothetical protein
VICKEPLPFDAITPNLGDVHTGFEAKAGYDMGMLRFSCEAVDEVNDRRQATVRAEQRGRPIPRSLISFIK